MQKITKLQLVIHLPHQLRVENNVGKEMELLGIKGEKALLKGKYFDSTVPLSSITPLLRPITQLTEKILHNGSFLTPYAILKLYNKDGYHFNIDERQLKTIIKQDRLDFGKMPYWMVIQCAHWQFDINGLLNQQLAKPIINTVQQ